jgi:hypothetical protein
LRLRLAQPLILPLRGVLPLWRRVLLQLPLPLLHPEFAHAFQVLGRGYAQLLRPCSTCWPRLVHHGRAEGQRPCPHGGAAPAAAAAVCLHNAGCEAPSPLQLLPALLLLSQTSLPGARSLRLVR